MKAITWREYGEPEVLVLEELSKPAPENNEVLIKIHASAVTAGDIRLRASRFPLGFWLPARLAFGLFKPGKLIPGMNFSGEIEAMGPDVTLFNKGDRVFGTTGLQLGAYAEYVCLAEDSALAAKPDNVTHEQAASVIFGGLTALHFLKDKAGIQRGQKVLINGASGSVGTSAVQLAKHLGAEVTGVCSGSKADFVSAIGADAVIDYSKEDFTKNNAVYDVIVDAAGTLSLSACRNSLSNTGKLVLINTGLWGTLSSLAKPNVITGVASEGKENLELLCKLVETDAIKPVVDRVFPLEKAAEAHSYADQGQKKGNVALAIA